MDIHKEILSDLGEVKKNLLLLLSSKSNEAIQGKLWYQKELFMLSKNNEELEEEAGFEAYFWGPYSELADEEMEELLQLGVVDKIGAKFILTKLGKEIALDIKKSLPTNENDLVEEVKEFLNDMSKDELLLFIYISYPNMTDDAVEFKKILPRRKDIAIGLYRKDKVSVGKAAELAGISVSEMVKILSDSKSYKVA